MNKLSILKKISAIANELDNQGFTKEASQLTQTMIRIAQSMNNTDYESNDTDYETPSHGNFDDENGMWAKENPDVTDELWNYVMSHKYDRLKDAVADDHDFAEFLWLQGDDFKEQALSDGIDLHSSLIRWDELDRKMMNLLNDLQNPEF